MDQRSSLRSPPAKGRGRSWGAKPAPEVSTNWFGVGAPAGSRKGLGWLVMLIPIACCGGPLLMVALAAAGTAVWGGLGAGAAIAVAVVLFIALRRRRGACGAAMCEPSAGGLAPGTSGDLGG
ncbi:MAG: hypothetical protein M0Z42_22740 [Actinomycetota bacterium]|jgi:hypothetical protein|nr:hypothetical protein [Actinomycetota bacterium]